LRITINKDDKSISGTTYLENKLLLAHSDNLLLGVARYLRTQLHIDLVDVLRGTLQFSRKRIIQIIHEFFILVTGPIGPALRHDIHPIPD
jgi:hypothetical protein